MERRARNHREVLLPAAALPALRRGLQEEAGALGSTHALRAAGYATGTILYETLAGEAGEDPAEMSEGRFWASVDRLFSRRGWGSVRQEAPHPGIGVLTTSDWVEAEGDREDQPACHFTTGLLAGLLGRVSGGELSVLEYRCRSQGEEACSFAFGAEPTLHVLYGRLLEGDDFEEALEALEAMEGARGG